MTGWPSSVFHAEHAIYKYITVVYLMSASQSLKISPPTNFLSSVDVKKWVDHAKNVGRSKKSP